MPDEDIDFSDIPPVSPARFPGAVVRQGLKPVARKGQLLRRINKLLGANKKAHRSK